jgi:hypothetical protein
MSSRDADQQASLGAPAGPSQSSPWVWGEAVPVSRASLDPRSLIRSSILRPLAELAVYILPGMALVMGFVTWWTLSHRALAIPTLAGVIGFAIALTIASLWLLAVAATNYAIILEPDGLVVLERSLARGKVLPHRYAWSELRRPALAGFLKEAVRIETDSRTIWLGLDQARALLRDPRCLLGKQLPPELARRVGMRGSPRSPSTSS